MRFEEVLPLIKKGKKAQMKSDKDEGTYWIAARQGFFNDKTENLFRTIVKMGKDGTYTPDKWSWGIPGWAVMAEDWEIIE